MIASSLGYLTPLLAMAAQAAPVRSGNAAADWITASQTYEAGQPVQTALRLVLDDGWHTYWSNPGEGGMKISVTWDLPEGWTASDPAHMVPKRFFTGELPGFGYEGTVLFPVSLTPPAGADAAVKLAAKISWLTCDDHSCVPGEAELVLHLEPGPAKTSADAALIEEAERKVPQPAAGLVLKVRESGDDVQLHLNATGDFEADPAACEVFPETPQVIDAAAPIRFKRSGTGWSAVVPRNEYADGPIGALTLVFAGEGAPSPFSVEWNGK